MWFVVVLGTRAIGIEEAETAPRSPWQNSRSSGDSACTELPLEHNWPGYLRTQRASVLSLRIESRSPSAKAGR